MKITKRVVFQIIGVITMPIWFLPMLLCACIWLLVDDMIISLWKALGELYDDISGRGNDDVL